MEIGGTKIGFELSEVNLSQFSNCFQFYDNLVGRDQVDPRLAHYNTFKAYLYRPFGIEGYPPVSQRDAHSGMVYTFEEART